MTQESSKDIWPNFTRPRELSVEVTPKPQQMPATQESRPPLQVVAYHAPNGSRIVRHTSLLSLQNSMLLCAIISLTAVDAHNMTACMCKRPQFLGAIDINRFGACNLPDLHAKFDQVQYSLYSLRRQQQFFAGYACRFWKNSVTVDSYWTGSLDTVYRTEKVTATPQQCWNAVTLKTCHGHEMLKDGSTWRYEARPSPRSRYRDTVITETVNCIVEPITLEMFSNSSAVHSVYGEVSTDVATEAAVHHGVTFVWKSQPTAQQVPCQYHRLYSGNAKVFNTSGQQRLRDPKYQLDFVIGPRISACGNVFYTVSGDHDLALQFNIITPENGPLHPRERLLLQAQQDRYRPPNSPPPELIEIMAHHLQYVEDTVTMQLNKVGSEIGFLDCLIETARLERVQLLSQFSGVLARKPSDLTTVIA